MVFVIILCLIKILNVYFHAQKDIMKRNFSTIQLLNSRRLAFLVLMDARNVLRIPVAHSVLNLILSFQYKLKRVC